MAKASIDLQNFEPHSMAQHIARKWDEWDIAREVWKQRIAETIQFVYATSTRETQGNGNNWSHSTVIPKLTQIHDNLGSNYASSLFSTPDFFSFDPAVYDEASERQRQAIDAYLRTKHSYSGFFGVMKTVLNDWVQTGNAFVRVEYVRELGTDPITKLPITLYEGPKLFRISPYDIVFDPTVAEFKDSPKIIREVVSLAELIRRVEDSPEGEEYDEAAVAQLTEIRHHLSAYNESQIDRSIQLSMDGFGTASRYYSSGKVELLHLMGDVWDMAKKELHRDVVTTVADRRWVLRNKPMADIQGFGRIYHAGWRRRTDNLWAQGPLDNLVGMQYLINHLENARADGFDQMLAPDRVIIGNVQEEKRGPVTTYYIDDGNGNVFNLSPDSTVLTADQQIQYKEAQMEAYAGAPREAMGLRTPGEKTKFEVETLANAATRLFQTRLEDFDEQLVTPVLQGELECAVNNLLTSDIAKVLDKDFGVEEFISITRDDLNVRGRLVALGSTHFAMRSKMVKELQQFSAILAGDADLRNHFPAKKRAEAWDKLLGLSRYELYSPFGAIEELSEMAELQKAAQSDLEQRDIAGDIANDQNLGPGLAPI